MRLTVEFFPESNAASQSANPYRVDLKMPDAETVVLKTFEEGGSGRIEPDVPAIMGNMMDTAQMAIRDLMRNK